MLRNMLSTWTLSSGCWKRINSMQSFPSVSLISQVKYLGHIVGCDGVKLASQRLAAVKDWPAPTDVHTLRCFLGLTNYIRNFVQGYAARVKPLTSLIKKHAKFVWSEKFQRPLMS